jgi:plastocyanin
MMVGVSAGGSVQDTVVVFDPLDAPAPSAGHATAIVDQVHKTFTPRVTVVRTGTVVSFPNNDNIHHEVYSFSAPHPFKLALFANEAHLSETFDKPGVILLGCNIHDSMLAFVVVVDSPYFVKLPASGRAAIDLPPGRYQPRVWNEHLATAKLPVLTVDADPVPLTAILDQAREAPDNWAD